MKKEWKLLLEELSKQILEDEWIKEDIEEEQVHSNWLGYAPATSKQINSKEKQLGVVLPSSYKEFLLTTNGFRYVDFLLDNLYPVEEIDWVSKLQPEWVAMFETMQQEQTNTVTDEDYFHYGPKQDPVHCREYYFKDCLQISDWFDGAICLLNPLVKNEGEWEVIYYALGKQEPVDTGLFGSLLKH